MSFGLAGYSAVKLSEKGFRTSFSESAGRIPIFGVNFCFVYSVDRKYGLRREHSITPSLIQVYYGSPTKWTFVSSLLLDRSKSR